LQPSFRKIAVFWSKFERETFKMRVCYVTAVSSHGHTLGLTSSIKGIRRRRWRWIGFVS
jgi:hypothetical protein